MQPNDSFREFERFFCPENQKERREVMSPSGRFRLEIRTYATKKGCWDYSRGTVYRVSDGREVCDIKRNYSAFHHTFVVKDGEEWLISGRSYMSQTIVNLETGRTFELAGDPFNGSAFCWAQCFLSPDGKTLAVDGCYWACPYEYKFFDFSQPEKGWPELPVSGEGRIEVVGERPPEWVDERMIVCYEAGESESPEELTAFTRLQRVGDSMSIREQWVSEKEAARREKDAREQAEAERWRERFAAEDPLFRRMVELAATYGIPDEGFVGWSTDTSANPVQHVVQKYFRRKSPKGSADLKWGVEQGPVTVTSYDEHGNTSGVLEFDRSVAGMEAAMRRVSEAFGVKVS